MEGRFWPWQGRSCPNGRLAAAANSRRRLLLARLRRTQLQASNQCGDDYHWLRRSRYLANDQGTCERFTVFQTKVMYVSK